MISIISWLQRAINTNDLEKWAKSAGIQLPIAQLIKSLVLNLFPLGIGSTVYGYISKNIEEFKHKPAQQIVSDLKSSGVNFELKEDLIFTLFGQKIVIKKTVAQDTSKYILYGITGVILLFMLTGSGKGKNANTH